MKADIFDCPGWFDEERRATDCGRTPQRDSLAGL